MLHLCRYWFFHSGQGLIMPTAVKLWKAALSQLQQLPAEVQHFPGFDSHGILRDTTLPQLLPSVVGIEDSPSNSSSVWKQLVYEIKVRAYKSWLNPSWEIVDMLPQPYDQGYLKHGL
jgi:hypothetical protein